MIFIYTGHVCKHLTLVQHSFCIFLKKKPARLLVIIPSPRHLPCTAGDPVPFGAMKHCGVARLVLLAAVSYGASFVGPGHDMRACDWAEITKALFQTKLHMFFFFMWEFPVGFPLNQSIDRCTSWQFQAFVMFSLGHGMISPADYISCFTGGCSTTRKTCNINQDIEGYSGIFWDNGIWIII